MFHMPMEELNERFTRSELAIVSWRSQEVSYQMGQRFKKGKKQGHEEGPAYDVKDYGPDSVVMQNLPQRFINEDGEIDMRKMTGKEAWSYMKNLGIVLPYFPR